MTNQTTAPSPAERYERHHPPVRNINTEIKAISTRGQRIADRLASLVGSWPFIIVQSCFLVAWLTVNAYLVVMAAKHPHFLRAWDPYPFILLNLVLSFQAAYTGPVVMMSQNRQSQRDRIEAEHDFQINQRAEEEIEVVLKELVHQDKLIWEAIKRIEGLHEALPMRELTEKLDAVLRRNDESGSSK